MSSNLLVSIIVVNYRTWEHVQYNLDSLFAQSSTTKIDSGKNVTFEVVIVDNHSDDGKLEEFRANNPSVKVILSKGNYGYAHGCNIGAQASQGDWLLFMNPDVISDKDNITKLVSVAIYQNWPILTAPQYDKKGRLQRAFGHFPSLITWFPAIRALLRWMLPTRYPNPRKNPNYIKEIVEVDWVSGSLILIRRGEFDQINGWDEDFWLYWEDVDLCRRARNQQIRIGYYPGAKFIHTHASSTRTNPKAAYLTKSETLISQYLYLTKHHSNSSSTILHYLYRARHIISSTSWSIVHLLTAGFSETTRHKRAIYDRVTNYYQRAKASGNYLSDQSIHFVEQADNSIQNHLTK